MSVELVDSENICSRCSGPFDISTGEVFINDEEGCSLTDTDVQQWALACEDCVAEFWEWIMEEDENGNQTRMLNFLEIN